MCLSDERMESTEQDGVEFFQQGKENKNKPVNVLNRRL